MRLWGNEGRSLMQIIHLLFALGGVTSPLITRPFLAQREREDIISYSKNRSGLLGNGTSNFPTINITSKLNSHQVHGFKNLTLHEGDLHSNFSSDDSNTTSMTILASAKRDTEVHYAFLISGIIAFVGSLPFLYALITDRSTGKEKRKISAAREDNTGYVRELSKPLHIFLSVSLCLCFFLYCSVEDTFASFLMTFVVREFKDVSKSQGAYITAIYWASFACSRFLMIFLAKVLSPSHILTLCGCVTFLSFSCFTISVHLRAITGVTVLAAFAGLGMSAVFPSGFSWSESKLLPVTPRLASGIFLGASVGTMTNPLLIGYLMEEVSNTWFCYVLLVQVSVLAVVFTFLSCFNKLYVIRRYGPLRRKEADLSAENTDLCLKPTEGLN